MHWRDTFSPQPMARIALVAPRVVLRDALVRVADAGTVELDRTGTADQPLAPAARLAGGAAVPRLEPQPPDLDGWARAGRTDLLAGEAQLEQYAAGAVDSGPVAAILGWAPVAALPALAERLTPVGAAAARLPRPRGIDPPTAARPGALRQGFSPLVRTYAVVPYVDVDPTLPAGLAYVVMFGAMFGDVGHGGLLVLAALVIRLGRAGRLRPYRLFLLGAGLSSMLFGLGYGECFGPTGLVPTWWLAPVEQPVPLLFAGLGLGAVLLAGAYVVGTVNRLHEGGWPLALYAPSGLAGSALFLAVGLAVAGLSTHLPWLWYAGLALAALALVLVYAGLLAAAGYRPTGILQATIELFDTVVRLGANVVSFARLAAFGLTHAVLGWIVWDATVGLWRRGWLGAAAAVLVFALGNALAFALEALVAGVQALRLSYYELFSRMFAVEGRPFRPWHLELSTVEDVEEPCTAK